MSFTPHNGLVICNQFVHCFQKAGPAFPPLYIVSIFVKHCRLDALSGEEEGGQR